MLQLIRILEWLVIVLGILDDQVLLAVLITGHYARLALVHPSPCTRPVHLVAGDLVLGERVLADFELSRASESGDKPHVICK